MDNKARIVLQNVYLERGAELYQDARLCRNLLNDMCGECYTEVRVLAVAVEEGIVQGLELQLRHQPRATVVAAAVATLARKAALKETAAEWAVESWITALEQSSSTAGDDLPAEENPGSQWESEADISQRSLNQPLAASATSLSGVQKLNDDSSLELLVGGEWLYYLNESDNHSIYRISTSGRRRQKLNEDCSWGLAIAGEWIYYINGSDRNSIYRLALDGSRRQKLNDDWSTNIVIAGDWLFFNERGHPCKMRIDGSQRQRLNLDHSRDLQVEGEWMYYINRSDRNRIYRMRSDNGGQSNDRPAATNGPECEASDETDSTGAPSAIGATSGINPGGS